MKIVIYSPTFYPVLDGTSLQATRMFNELKPIYKVFGIGYAVNRNMIFDEKLLQISDGISRLLPDSVKGLNRFPKLSGNNASIRIKEIEPDIIHIRGWYQHNALNTIINESVKSHCRIYWHGDGLHECHEVFKKNREYSQIIENAIKKNVNFFGNSEEDKVLFLKLGIPENKIFIVAPFLPEVQLTLKDWSNPRIITLGRFFEFKKHDKVISVANKINPCIEVISAGASDTTFFKKFLKKNQLKSSIIIDPSNDLVQILYNSSTHFVLASEIETLGIATLEAVKAGCIPLVRNIGGIVSYLPDKYLFSSDNELELKLKKLLDPQNAIKAFNELEPLRKSLSNKITISKLQHIYINSK